MVHDIDVDAFGIVTRNLIENAIIHGEPNTPVNISVAGDGSIHIVNECAVLANLTLLEMKKRFTRGNNKASGSGLGLAISDQLVKQMGGTLDLYSPVPGRDTGFEAVLSFQPLQPSEESRNCSHS
jgi:two-component system OmpR family sensor kinase